MRRGSDVQKIAFVLIKKKWTRVGIAIEQPDNGHWDIVIDEDLSREALAEALKWCMESRFNVGLRLDDAPPEPHDDEWKPAPKVKQDITIVESSRQQITIVNPLGRSRFHDLNYGERW